MFYDLDTYLYIKFVFNHAFYFIDLQSENRKVPEI